MNLQRTRRSPALRFISVLAAVSACSLFVACGDDANLPEDVTRIEDIPLPSNSRPAPPPPPAAEADPAPEAPGDDSDRPSADDLDNLAGLGNRDNDEGPEDTEPEATPAPETIHTRRSPCWEIALAAAEFG